MSERDNLQVKAKLQFKQFLLASKQRQTPERFAILAAAYDIEGFFTIEDLQEELLKSNFKVSVATLYNTVALLVQANLLIRHPFSSSASLYERIADEKPRCYQICNNCHNITRITSRELAAVVNSYKPRRFVPSHRVLYVYGVCPRCDKTLRKVRQLFLEL